MNDLPTVTVTLFATDIVNSTALWERHHDEMSAALARHDAILRHAVESLGGHIFKMVGDGCYAAFADATDAVAAALAAQRLLVAEPWDLPEPLRVRMALHSGMVERRADDYFGPALNCIAHLVAVAHGGQILLSLVTAALLRDHLPSDVLLHDVGLHQLKGSAQRQRVFQLVAPDLPGDFPPLNTRDGMMYNIPAQPTALIGREWERANVSALLRRDDVRLVTLTGPGGIGKTRLALQVALDLVDQFPEGVFFVSLAPVGDASLFIATLAQTLGIRESAGQDLANQLKEYLRTKHLLLLLDNFEHLGAAAPRIADLLTATDELKILTTSRAPLRLAGEHEYAVPPLTLPDRVHLPVDRLDQHTAVRLFVERAQAVKSDFALASGNGSAIAEICRRLDGLPLAIELAAARVKLFAPIALLERLRSPLAFLVTKTRDLPARQQTLRATIDWSYNLLSADEQRVFTCLAVFVGGCTVAAAEAVCQSLYAGNAAHPINVLDTIESLLDQNLLRQSENGVDEPRIGMLETIREYALECLSTSVEAPAIQQQHAKYYLDLAEKAGAQLQGAEQSAWLARLEAEYGNIRAALEWSQVYAPEQGLRLAVALWRFWELHGHLSEGRMWLHAFLDAHSSAPALLRARALHALGVLIQFQGEYQQAQLLMLRSLSLFQAAQDAVRTAHVLCSLGLVSWFQGNQAAAQAYFEQSAALYRQEQYTWGIADAIHYLGHVVLDQGDVEAARALFEESLMLFRQTGDKRNIALPLKDFGLIASHQGDYAAAIPLYEESLALSRDVEDSYHITDTLQRLGDLARLQGDYGRATAIYAECLDLWQKLGNKGGVAEALNLLGEAATVQQDYAQARRYYEESLAIHRQIGSKRVIAAVLHNLGRVAQHEHTDERAFALFAESLALNAAIDYKPGCADCLAGLACVALAQGDAERAARLLAAAEPHLESMRGFMPLADRSSYNAALAAVQEHLDEHAFATLWAAGQATPLDQMIAYAQERAVAAETQMVTTARAVGVTAPALYPAGLTRREVEVLRLVAQGLSDAQVAEALIISPRTVHGHLRSIYSKLGVNSRTAAARFAVEHQLV